MNHSFESMAGFQQEAFTLTGRGEPVFTMAGMVTASFFPLVGARTILGRTFDDTEDVSSAPRVAVVGYEFWTSRLGGDPKIVGSTLALDGKPYEVLGVLRPGLRFFGRPLDFYLSLGATQNAAAPRAQHGSIRVLGRLKEGVTLSSALADLDGIMQRLSKESPSPEDTHRALGAFLTEVWTEEVRPTLLMLMGAVGLVLLIACANVAGLLLARGTVRIREIAIRSSIGAGFGRLARQFLTENLLVSALGGGAGLVLASGCLRALIAYASIAAGRRDSTGRAGPVIYGGADDRYRNCRWLGTRVHASPVRPDRGAEQRGTIDDRGARAIAAAERSGRRRDRCDPCAGVRFDTFATNPDCGAEPRSRL